MKPIAAFHLPLSLPWIAPAAPPAFENTAAPGGWTVVKGQAEPGNVLQARCPSRAQCSARGGLRRSVVPLLALLLLPLGASAAEPARPLPGEGGPPAGEETLVAGPASAKPELAPGRPMARVDVSTRNRSKAAFPILLAEGGTAKLPVVVSPNADPAVRARAEELAACLGKMAGARFELKEVGAGPGILVGTIAEFPTPSAVEGLRVFDVYDGREAFAIRTEGGSVKLLGATPLGASHAVSRFLEDLGCRWFFMGPAWEVIPKVPRLAYGLNATDRPEVLSRYFGHPRGDGHEKGDPDAGEELRAWWRRNLVGKSLKTYCGHCAHVLVLRFQKEFEEHPEYRALLPDGKRTGDGKKGTKSWMWGQLCVSNPRVAELAIQLAREQLDKDPGADMVGVGPDDGGGWCTCAECAKLGDPGNQPFHLANKVAKALQESHPGKMVGLLAYNYHCDPPGFALEPNVYVELTTSLLLNTKLGFDRLLEEWPKKCRYFGLYDYWAVYDWIRDRLPSGRTGNTGYVAKELPRYVRHGICCLSAESGNSWGSQGLGYWLASRVLWNSSADTEALKKDFYEKAFGPAAAAMQRYYERVDLKDRPFVGPSFYRLCLDDLDAAAKAAEGNPEVAARVELLRQYQVYVWLFNKVQVKKNEVPTAEKKRDALELLKWSWLIRNNYMIFWTFFTDQTTRRMAEEYREPSWFWYQMHRDKKADQIPYRKAGAVPDPKETDRCFAEMKAAYGEVPRVEEKSFGGALVLPRWPSDGPKDKERGYPLTQGYLFQGAAPDLMLASVGGEPLRLVIRHGTIYKQMPPGEYALLDATGKQVARAKVPHGETKLELNVPGPGIYAFRYDDHGAGVAILPDEKLQGAFALERGKRFGAYNYLTSFFYVPKGTKTLYLYCNKGGELFGLRDPEGNWVGDPPEPVDGKAKPSPLRLVGDGRYMAIPVPTGTDGQAWSGLMLNRSTLWFFNAPNYLAMSRDGVLVPEELARKDGLKW